MNVKIDKTQGNWELDLISNKLHWSDNQYKIYGYKPNEFPLDAECFIIKTTHASDIDRITKIVNDAIAKYNSCTFNRRIIKKNGTHAYVKTTADIHRINGVATKIVGMTEEITNSFDGDYSCPNFFKSVYLNYKKTIFFEILKFIPDKDIAKDICQEVFIKAWHKMSQYDPTKGEIYTWLVNIARNHCKDYLRSKQFKVYKNSFSMDETQHSSLKHESFNLNKLDINMLLGQLTGSQKEIMALLFLEGYTQTQVSEMQQVSLSSIKRASRSAINRLRKIVDL